MSKDEFVDLSATALLVEVLERRTVRPRQALIAVADREETGFEAVRHALRATTGAVVPPSRVLMLCDRLARGAISSHRAPLPSSLQIRVVDEMPFQFAVFDREVAFTLQGSAPVETQEPAVVESLANCFDSLWRRGRLLTAGPSHPDVERGTWADEVQLDIMMRLVNGDTEDKIGRSLGISRRTVAAHVARISHRLGSTSRTQLGYLIAKRNLLDSYDLAE
ncbi:LuxR C-terminal-related transcriptional regulator [Streptomyces nodosus]